MRSRATVTAAATLAVGSALAFAEAPAPPTPVIQVGVDVIRIDATVTDQDGRPVTDLRPEDFRLKVNGQPVPVANAAFFGGTPAAGDAARDTGPERSIVFVIDDLYLSPDGVAWARDALRAFGSRWDSVDAAIGVRYTSDESDKVLLSRNPARFDAAIRGFRYRPNRDLNNLQQAATFQQRIYSILTTLNALRSAPGRKAMILVSDGLWVDPVRDSRDQFRIRSPFDSLFEDGNSDAALRMIVEVANRASTVIHAVHPSGIGAPWPGASSTGGSSWFGTVTSVASVANAGGAEEPLGPAVSGALDQMERRQSLQTVASETGGLAFFGRNGVERALQTIAEDQRSYYLIGFEPPKSTFARSLFKTPFRKIKLTVDRPDVRVRTRAGFYGVTDDEVLAQAPLSVAMTPAPLPIP